MADLLNEGINFFNAGRFYDAHEAWEDLWRTSSGPVRLFYQGLVQAAVAMHHLSAGNLGGAKSQFGKSLEKLQQYPQTFCDIDNGTLVANLRIKLAELKPGQFSISRL